MPTSGSAARVEGRGQAFDTGSVDAKIADGISADLTKMELLWAQKYARGYSKPPITKEDREESCGSSRGEASFFLGGLAEEAECNMANLVQFGEVCESLTMTE